MAIAPGAARLLKAALVLAAVAAGLRWCYLYPLHGAEAAERNTKNEAAAAHVVAALERYKAQFGAYPRTLAAIYPSTLARLPELADHSHLFYSTQPDGRQCWLAVFPHYRAGVFPSDFGREYECAARTWSHRDYAEPRARADPGWNELIERASNPALALSGAKGERAFHVLGWIDEYAGHPFLADRVEGFYAEEASLVPEFIAALEAMARDQGVEPRVEVARAAGGAAILRSEPALHERAHTSELADRIGQCARARHRRRLRRSCRHRRSCRPRYPSSTS